MVNKLKVINFLQDFGCARLDQLQKLYRKKKSLSKIELSRLLQLHAVYIDSTELKRIETGQMIVKDFELIGLCKVLDINYDELKDLIE